MLLLLKVYVRPDPFFHFLGFQDQWTLSQTFFCLKKSNSNNIFCFTLLTYIIKNNLSSFSIFINLYDSGHRAYSPVCIIHLTYVYCWWWCVVQNIYLHLQIIIQTQLLFRIQRARWWKMCNVHNSKHFLFSSFQTKYNLECNFQAK